MNQPLEWNGETMNATGIVTASQLNVRGGPSTGEPIRGQLPRGSRVEVLDISGGWYRIRSDAGPEGFVHGSFLKILDDEPAASFLYEDAGLASVPLAAAERDAIPTGSLSGRRRDVARTWNRYGGLLAELSETMAIDPGCAVAVLLVESGGVGFGRDGRMIIRFECHKFWSFWGRANRPVFEKHFRFSGQKCWQGHEFCEIPDAPWDGFHGDQSKEWRVFEFARGLHEPAAMMSISMGLPQIMGFNHAEIGYDGVRGMFENFSADVRFQILGLFDFIRGKGTTSSMLQALQRHDFDRFASLYNGPGQAAKYGGWIGERFGIFCELRDHA